MGPVRVTLPGEPCNHVVTSISWWWRETVETYFFSVHCAIRAVDHRRVAGGRHQSQRPVFVLGQQGGLHAAVERVLGHGPYRTVGPVAPVDIPFVQRHRERLVVRAADQLPPGSDVQVHALDAVVHPFALVAPVQPVAFHVYRDRERLVQGPVLQQHFAPGPVQKRPFNGRVLMVAIGPVQVSAGATTRRTFRTQ